MTDWGSGWSPSANELPAPHQLPGLRAHSWRQKWRPSHCPGVRRDILSPSEDVLEPSTGLAPGCPGRWDTWVMASSRGRGAVGEALEDGASGGSPGGLGPWHRVAGPCGEVSGSCGGGTAWGCPILGVGSRFPGKSGKSEPENLKAALPQPLSPLSQGLSGSGNSGRSTCAGQHLCSPGSVPTGRTPLSPRAALWARALGTVVILSQEIWRSQGAVTWVGGCEPGVLACLGPHRALLSWAEASHMCQHGQSQAFGDPGPRPPRVAGRQRRAG